jgi:hypothetical protein
VGDSSEEVDMSCRIAMLMALILAASGPAVANELQRAQQRVLKQHGTPWVRHDRCAMSYRTEAEDIKRLGSGTVVLRQFKLIYPTPDGKLEDLVTYNRRGVRPPSASSARLDHTVYIKRPGAETTTFTQVTPDGKRYYGTMNQRPSGWVAVTIDAKDSSKGKRTRVLTSLYNPQSRKFLVRHKGQSYRFQDGKSFGSYMSGGEIDITGYALFQRLMTGAQGGMDPAYRIAR